MSTALALPDAFKTGPSQKFQAVAARAALSDGIGSSYGLIGYKGKTWSLRYRGETYNFTRPDGTPTGYIDVVLLRTAANKSKSYYEGGYDQEGSAGKAPTCSSLDGVTPDQGVTTKQSEACAVCPKNEWKKDAKGRNSRECSDYKRVAVLLMPYMTTPLLGAALMEPIFLRVPAASLNDLATFGDTMAAQGFDFSAFITRITFDPDMAHPKFVFKPVAPLTDDEADVILPFITDQQALRITGEDLIAKGAPRLAAPAPQAQLAAPAPAQPALSQPSTLVAQPANAQPAPPVQPPASPPPPVIPAGGSGLVGASKAAPASSLVTAAAAPPPPQPVQQVASDTTVATASEDLDARVKRLLHSAA